MKNMMSQVGNCKKLFALCSLFLVLCSLTGCKDKGRVPESLVGNASRPTWTIASDYDFAASMTAVIKVDLAAQYPNSAADFVLDDSDLVAAFSGETCLGVASPNEGFFYLYIGAPIGVTPTSVTLRYYSAHYKNLFEAKDAFPYVSDTQQGYADEPFIPAFVCAP